MMAFRAAWHLRAGASIGLPSEEKKKGDLRPVKNFGSHLLPQISVKLPLLRPAKIHLRIPRWVSCTRTFLHNHLRLLFFLLPPESLSTLLPDTNMSAFKLLASALLVTACSALPVS